ncbi:MAG TPA: secondary thiamine-phosphate synthase enzyme YjbQ [Tepidisphaeraceae bacterium]|nr:secondary thiamine-phosphate synthase enzyme YjbQ [Tepidisphaeraceae bacterium]
MPSIKIETEVLRTTARSQMVEVTDAVQKVVSKHNVQEGLAIVHVPHTTAAVTINENADPDVKHDMLRKLESLIPQHESYYKHGEGNSDSHVKTSLVGNSVTVLISRGKLVLGTWQGIQFCEFDGPRSRQFMVRVVSFDRAEG